MNTPHLSIERRGRRAPRGLCQRPRTTRLRHCLLCHCGRGGGGERSEFEDAGGIHVMRRAKAQASKGRRGAAVYNEVSQSAARGAPAAGAARASTRACAAAAAVRRHTRCCAVAPLAAATLNVRPEGAHENVGRHQQARRAGELNCSFKL